MIEPYNAVGLIPSFWGIRRREEIKHNIEHLKGLTKAAFWLSNLDIPVKLLAIPEGAMMGFNDEVLDVDHADYARTCCIDIPGPETDEIGKLATRANVKTVVLSHFLPATDPKDDYARFGEQVSKHFSGKVLVAKDLMEF